MKRYTQEEFDALPRNVDGFKECPAGDYVDIRKFGRRCSFGKYLPSPIMLLQCLWGNVSDSLCLELMRYDASNHPNPEKFNVWAKGGACPYGEGFVRCVNFCEKRELWEPGIAKTARELAIMLLEEKHITCQCKL